MVIAGMLQRNKKAGLGPPFILKVKELINPYYETLFVHHHPAPVCQLVY